MNGESLLFRLFTSLLPFWLMKIVSIYDDPRNIE